MTKVAPVTHAAWAWNPPDCSLPYRGPDDARVTQNAHGEPAVTRCHPRASRSTRTASNVVSRPPFNTFRDVAPDSRTNAALRAACTDIPPANDRRT